MTRSAPFPNPRDGAPGAAAAVPTSYVTVGEITAAVGPLTTTNADLAERFGRPADLITRKIGIETRPLAPPDMDPKDLAIQAARPLFESPDFDPTRLSLIITASSSVNQVCPPVSCEVLAAMAATREGVPSVMAFDIMATCPGWLYALALACDHLHQPANRLRTALLITTEIFTQGLDPEDFASWASFGDAATATLVYGPDCPINLVPTDAAAGTFIQMLRPHTFAKPDTAQTLWGPPLRTSRYLKMNGPGMRAESMPAMALAMQEAATAAGLSTADLDALFAHQSNYKILADLASTLQMPPDHLPSNLPWRGNTSSCALPLLLHDVRAGLVEGCALRPGQTLGFTSFGGGFTSAAAVGRVLG